MITPPIDCASLNRISLYTSAATFRAQVLAGKCLHGASLTDGALNPLDPVGAAACFASFGFNHARFHHGEFQHVGQMVYFADQLLLKGVRFSVGLADKLGEKYVSGIEGFKRDLLDQVPEAEDLYVANIIRMGPLLRHKGCFMAVLSNEPFHLSTPEKSRRFWLKWSPVVRDMNPTLLLTDGGDPQVNIPEYGEVAKLYDIAVFHLYGSDGNADGTSNLIYEGWHTRIANWYADICGKRMIVNEFGSYASNPHQMSNIAFVMLQCLRYGWSCTHFSFASNEEGWSGTGADKFTITNDPCRHSLAILGAHLNKYGAKGGYCEWGGDTEQWGTTYKYVCPNVWADENHVKVRVSSTKTLVWGLDKNQEWQWLNRTVTPEGPFVAVA